MSQASLDLAKHLYEAVLGRDPDATDQANFAAYLDTGGNGAAALAGSGEAAAQVGAVYWQVLGRAASGTEVAAWQSYLAGGGTLAGIHEAAANSDEAGFAIDSLYGNGLDRNASVPEITAWKRYLAGGGTFARLRAAVGGSTEAATVVDALYKAVLGRGADAVGGPNAQAAIANGTTLTQILHGMATSAEEGARLSATYQAAAGQAPDAATLATMEGQVESDTSTGWLAARYNDGPAYPFPVPDYTGDFTSGGSSIISDGGPTVGITGVTLGTESGTVLSTTSSTPTISGASSAGSLVLVDANGQPVSHGVGTVAITASLLGLDLPASTFVAATVDMAGDWAAVPSHALPDATYTLTPTLTYADGTTATGNPFTLDIAAGAAHAAIASLSVADMAAHSAVPLLHAS